MGEGEQRLRRFRVQRDGPAQRLQRPPGVAQGGERLAEVALGHGVLGPAPQRGPEKGNRIPQFARFGQRAAVVGEEHRRFRLEGERARRVAERRPRVAPLPRHHPEQVVGVGVARPGRGGPAVQAFGGREVARAVEGHALRQQGVGVVLRHRRILERRAAPGNVSAAGSRLRTCGIVMLRSRIKTVPLRPPKPHSDTGTGHAQNTLAINPRRPETDGRKTH